MSPLREDNKKTEKNITAIKFILCSLRSKVLFSLRQPIIRPYVFDLSHCSVFQKKSTLEEQLCSFFIQTVVISSFVCFCAVQLDKGMEPGKLGGGGGEL